MQQPPSLRNPSQPLSLAKVGRSTPVLLAPVCRTTEVIASTAEVRSRAAQACLAFLVDNRSAGLTLTRIRAPRNGRLSRRLLGVALSVAGLAAVTAVQRLVLDVVLGSAVAGGRAAAVEVTVGSGAGAGDAALRVAADVDDGDGGGEGLSRGGGGGGLGGGLQGSGSLGGAGGTGCGEGLQAGGRVAVVLGATALWCVSWTALVCSWFGQGVPIHTESSSCCPCRPSFRTWDRSARGQPER